MIVISSRLKLSVDWFRALWFWLRIKQICAFYFQKAFLLFCYISFEAILIFPSICPDKVVIFFVRREGTLVLFQFWIFEKARMFAIDFVCVKKMFVLFLGAFLTQRISTNGQKFLLFLLFHWKCIELTGIDWNSYI